MKKPSWKPFDGGVGGLVLAGYSVENNLHDKRLDSSFRRNHRLRTRSDESVFVDFASRRPDLYLYVPAEISRRSGAL
jgi:hypothetical protein